MHQGFRVMPGIAIAFTLASAAIASADDGPEHSLYVRGGAVTEGVQHTLKKGVELGLGYERRLGDAFTLGAGVGFARQGSRFDHDEYVAQATSFEGHGRWSIGRARIRPHLETGLGVYVFHSRAVWRAGQPGFAADWSAPGAWLGLGAGTRVTPALSVRLGIAYHLIAQSISVDTGGNVEDYFATGLTLAFGLPGR
jgi:opacity protein-like surface antigen